MEFNATFLAAAISFIIFTLLMNKILYQPILAIIEKRKAYLDANSAETKLNLENADAIREDKDKHISESRMEAKKSVMAEVEAAKQQKAKMEAEKKQNLVNALAEQKVELENEKNRVTEELNPKCEELSDFIVDKFLGGER